MLPEPDNFATYFHLAYKVNEENLRKRIEWKKLKKKLDRTRYKHKKLELLYDNDTHSPADIQLPSNASSFAVFATIRLAVLDRWMRNSSQGYLENSYSASNSEHHYYFDSDCDDDSSSNYEPLRVSKIVELGLRSVFELIKESRSSYPELCAKALSALLDVLQGQTLESLKPEPSDVIDPLFDLLLDLATSHGPESSVANDGSHVTALACSCLLSLVVVRGDTGKCLSAIAALLMSPRALALQNIQMSSVLSAMQRSVHSVLLGKLLRPDWISHGVPSTSKTDSFHLKLPPDLNLAQATLKSLAFDGQFLYIFCSRGLLKVGSGYGGTVKGQTVLWNPAFCSDLHGTLVFCSGKLYLKLSGKRGANVFIVNTNNCSSIGSVPLHSRDADSPVVFSDGEHLGTISLAKDDGIVVRTLNQNTIPASLITELPLKLVRKCFDVIGQTPFEDEVGCYRVSIGNDEEIASICSGKEFILIRTLSGKVFYSGKPSALGIKQAGVRSNKWSELVLTKSPKVVRVATGHESLHAIIITEDGSVFFTGTARRGEDGDQSKVRRQPKPVKPKKMIKVEGHHVLLGACNNGTTALITKEGKLLMFGKDTAHADPSTGVVTGLKGEFVLNAVLGKAHAVVLTDKGQIYTFGINNKFQCGREFTKSNKEAFCTNVAVAMETCSAQDDHDAYDDPEENQKEHETSSLAAAPGCSEGNLGEPQNVCPQGMHQWHDNMCMVCTVCRECTGYSISCLSSMSSDRNPGQECGCGEGDSGCSICGCCRICAREVVDNSELADLAGMMRLDLIFRDNKIVIPPRQRTKLQEQIQSRLEERKNKTKKSLAGSSKQLGKMKSTRSGITATPTHRSNNTTRHTNLCTVKEQTSSDVERESARIACLPPAPLPLPCDSPVVQIACGLHHSVLLLHNGDVLTFGSNLYGQLGCGDILAKNTVQKVNLPANADLVAAGSNHTVVMTVEGEVYTFGNPEKGQLGRPPPQDAPQSSQGSSSSTTSFNNPRTPWYSVPGVMPNVGPKFGRRAIWIGASGDQTFVKLDESLINSVSISKSTVTANKNSIVLLPSQETACRNFKCLVINKKDGNCNSFANCDQADFSNKLICMDPIYNVLWSYNPSSNKMTCYNIINTELQSADCAKITQMKNVKNVCTERKTTSSEKLKDLGIILSPELALPVSSNCHVTRFQAAINLLCCLDTLTAAQELHLSAIKEQIEEKQAAAAGKMHSKENYQFVNRFESHGGGWGYSGHSVEAVRFMADTDILLGGYGLFGGRGEYTAKIKLLELGPNGGELDQNGTPKADTYETPYECGPRQKYAMFFDAPIPLQAHHWYIAWCQISGPSSDCGSSGQAMVTTEDQVTFYFKSSKMSNNGTDVNAGQIPQLIYKIITPEIKIPTKQVDVTEPVHILSKEFSKTVSKECFQSLLSLLQWSWNTFKCGVTDGQSSKNTYTTMELERLVYISTASLRLIRIYINEIYPKYYNTEKELLETVQLAECIGDIRTLLKQILSDNVPLSVQNKKGTSENVVKKYASGKSSNTPNQKSHSVTLMKSILDQCHNTFVSCFHAFYPTTFLKWNCLCELLADSTNEEQNTSTNGQMLLSAVLCALCDPNLKLRETFPLLGNNANTDNSLDKSDNSGLPMLSMTGSYHHPILVEQMSYRSQIESIYTDLSWQWKDVLQRLIHLVSEPVLRALQENAETSFSELSKYCCHLLGRVLAELVLQCNSIEQDPQNTLGRTLHVTPSRFTRTNQSRTWNTGNGAPDAICFQVDRAGVSVQGVGVYGGVGHYEYELELLEDTSSCNGLQNHAAHRWSSLETIRGYISPEDYAPDIMDLKFDRLVPIKANVKYALRLRNHGGRTNNGDGGLSSVKGSDNTTFTFSTCSLSFNGTTVTRGQIPVIYYYSDPIEGTKGLSTRVEMKARQTALSMTSDIVQNACKLMILAREKADEMPSANVLSNSCLVKTLLPLVLAHVSPLASSDPKSAIHVSTLIQDILPHVAALNLSSLTSPASKSLINSQEMLENKVNTTSNHCTIVESDHPYKPTTVANYRVAFPESVKWMSLEFDPSCSTAQPEDSLQLYVPSFEQIDNKRGRTEEYDVPAMPYWPVLHKFSGSFQWPKNTVILPGNEVVFSLETASDYLKDDRASSYGFKCLVIGYEWPLESNPNPGLKHLEMELAFLGGMCASSLMKKDILLPPIGYDDVDMKAAELVTLQTFYQHGALLSKGLALSAPPSVNQALDGTLPFSAHSNERLFLRDFVMCVQGSSGGRLAQWLQPGSRVDPSKCQVMYSREDLRCGWPATITILTRDQYSDLVQVPNMKVDVRAIPIDKKELGNSDASRKMRRVSQAEPLTFGNLPAPPLQVSYEKTVRDKMCFHSITAMKPFQNYSFEELRYLSPPVRRSSENMLVRQNGDGSYSATWTPGTIGCYSLVVNLDGYEMEEAFKVEVKEPPQGVLPPNQNVSKKSSNQPSKVRKFVAKNSAGLRIRAHPSLQSEQIGVVHVNGIITFIDEIHNDDGVWLRLSQDTIKQYCNSHIIEAWCLQYNQHLGKTLLLPVEEQKSVLDQVISDTIMRKLPEIQDQSAKSSTVYRVIKCGASGHNIRSRPSLKAAPVGILVLGNRVGVSEFLVNSEGCWVLLDKNTTEQYCFDTGGEAWSLAIGTNNVLYLENVNETDDHPKLPSDITKMHKRGYNFSCSKPNNEFAFASSATPVIPKDHSSSTNPFVFGESDVQKVKREFLRDSKFKDLGGSNGNGITPPGTPKRPQSPRATGILSPKIASRSCSPMTIPSRATSSHDSSPSHIGGSSRSIGISPLASSTGSSQDSPPILRRDSSQSDTNLLEPEQSPKKLTQTGTQTSPENTNNVPVKGHFSIGATHKEERVSPKMLRKDRGLAKSRPKRAISPANMHNQIPTSSKMSFTGGEQAKTAVSPSVAESLRAVFAAFLWQEGIVHDAMACASFLKFHPTLPKQGALVVTRNQELPVDIRRKELTKEERARQRHSVEVSNAGNYLHIQPSTLESLTRSAANANANRNRPRKRTDGIIKEENDPKSGSDSSSYGYQTISVLPPALKSLVHLWEELTTNCLQVINEQAVGSPIKQCKRSDTIDGEKEEKDNKKGGNEKEGKKNKKKKILPRGYLDDIGFSSYAHTSCTETYCELCGEVFPHPVTYHMRGEHPGCGQHAGGQGYNSAGNYCLGWAGNCGDGGVHGSSWYLLCDGCREKYVKMYRGKATTPTLRAAGSKKKHSSYAFNPSEQEPHIIMKNNALFLLDMASSAESNITNQRRSSISIMPSVSENNSPPDCYGPFGPPPPFQCLQTLGANMGGEDAYFINDVLLKNNLLDGGFGVGSSNVSQRPLSDVSVSENETELGKGMRFHRSVSMGTNGIPWSKSGHDGRIIMMRKRNNSSSEIANDGGSSLLCHPSTALQKLIPKSDLTAIVKNEDDSEDKSDLNLLQRPALKFIVQQHDLNSLKIVMKQAIRKAMCRVFALQAINWLLRSVTQPTCLHDLLWWFVSSLTPVEVEPVPEEDNKPPKRSEEQDLQMREHPLWDIAVAGDAVHPLPSTFHALLQTIANLMVLLPMGSPLQQIAVRCWGLRFASSDHSFLHRSQVFNNISKILSRSEELEDFTVSMHESHHSLYNQITWTVESLKDLTPSVEIKASSRQAMIGSLTDGSTETFWESGDEDRNKTKTITIICPPGNLPSLVSVHVDNSRDVGYKISTITFLSGPNTDALVKLRTTEVEVKILGGWVHCPITEATDSVIRLELRSTDNSVRLRQIKVLGTVEGESRKIGKQYSASTIQQRNCEAETLRVFRLITSQVFGKLIQGDKAQNAANNGENGAALSPNEGMEPLEESNELREHMVGILFSRSKLTHLQKQVIVHIVQAIRKETERVKDEWENTVCTTSTTSNQSGSDAAKNSDTYCFEMLSMVLALSGSSVGRSYLSHQGGLLGDLLTLLHTGSARVQRQVTSLLRRMLPEITPEFFAKVVGVTNLPPKDFDIVSVINKDSNAQKFDANRPGILDIFLAVIAKSLTVQIKTRGKTGTAGTSKEVSTVTLATSVLPRDYLRNRWWLRGTTNRKLAEVMVQLITDMSSGKMSDIWANTTKGAIAENILHLTYLNEEERNPDFCLKNPTLWIALASLCVLDKDHVDRLSSGQWSKTENQTVPPRPLCSNHDDGETTAVIQCNSCGNLCTDCDRFLHLNRKYRNHQRQVCKEEEEAIKVELHEGCGRTKLFWLLALADSRTLKALVEFREGGTKTKIAGITGMCRFCGTTGNSGLLAIGNVCVDADCQEYGKVACTKMLSCGHMCGGVLNEAKCLPCLHGCSNDVTLRQDSDDMCMICFTEALSCAPSIQLQCGHVFHLHCCKAVLMKRWAGPRITFSFSLCPICKIEMQHNTLEDLLKPVQELFKDVRRKALMRLEYEGLHKVEAVVTPGGRFYNDPTSYAMDRYAYYVCYKCNKAYYGGEARCDAEIGENYDPTELVCGACSDIARAQMCPKHGTDFLEYKCRYCCSVAVFFCFGTTHFCNPCHDDFQRVTNLLKNELPVCPAGARATQLEGDECPLHVKHPPTGEEFALGCGVCRNAHTF